MVRVLPALPKYPAPDVPAAEVPVGEIPPTVTVASVLLVVNLVLSILVTILSLTHIDSLVRLALQHQQSTNSATLTRDSVRVGLYVRAAVNVAIGVFYFFLISRLRRRRWWAWRRMVWISMVGSLGVIYLLTQPYTTIFKVEQALQLIVLVSIGVAMLHPETRAFIGPRPPGRRRRGRARVG
jgi:hypothetical protein